MAVITPESNLLLKIQQRILDNIPEIRWIDADQGQLEFFTSTRPPVVFPCALIDVQDITYRDMQDMMQQAIGNFTIRIAIEPAATFSSTTPTQYKEKAITHFELAGKVAKWLNNWRADGILTIDFTRKSLVTEKRDDPYRVLLLTFECRWIDTGQANQGNATVSSFSYATTGNEDGIITADQLKNVTIIWLDRSDAWWGVATEGQPTLEPRKAIHDPVNGTLTFASNFGAGETVGMLLKGL
ncbi:MAG: hypothetical protein J0M30_14765 [Chitinophagales bacterium]|nr:hypothetical protein [Chitinophagales bacterium]